MASKISTILSLFFVMTFFLFSSDIINIQYQYSALDAVSININALLANTAGEFASVKSFLSKNYPKVAYQTETDVIALGEPFTYRLTLEYNPLFMNSGDVMSISIKRSVVIGHLN